MKFKKTLILLICITCTLLFSCAKQQGNEGTKVFDKAGTYSEMTTCENAIIKADGVVVENLKVSGDVTISAEVGEGTVTLRGCSIGGTLNVHGGGRNSTHLERTDVGAITSDKKNTHIILDSKSKTKLLTLNATAFLEIFGQADDVTVSSTSSGSEVIVGAGSHVNFITANAQTALTTFSPIDHITVGASAGGTTLLANEPVGTIDLSARTGMVLNANVHNVLLQKTAEGTSMNVGRNIMVDSLATQTKVITTGDGLIGALFTNDAGNVTGSVASEKTTVTQTPMEAAQAAQAAETAGPPVSELPNLGPVKPVTPPLPDPVLPPAEPTQPVEPEGPKPILVDSVTIGKNDPILRVGKTVTLTATVQPANATDKTIVWTSDRPTVATVTDGIVTGVKAGTAKITATAQGGKAASFDVQVVDEVTTQAALKAAVDAAVPDQTIYVAGTISLTEPLVLTKSVILKGIDRDKTVLSATSGNAIHVNNGVHLTLDCIQVKVTAAGRAINPVNASGALSNTKIVLKSSRIDYGQRGGRGISLGADTMTDNNHIEIIDSEIVCTDANGNSTTANRGISFYKSSNSSLKVSGSTITAGHYALCLNSPSLQVDIDDSTLKGYSCITLNNTDTVINVTNTRMTGKTYWGIGNNDYGAVAFEPAAQRTVMNITNCVITNEFGPTGLSAERLFDIDGADNTINIDVATQLLNTDKIKVPCPIVCYDTNRVLIGGLPWDQVL